MRRHIVESHLISHHHYLVRTVSGSSALPCAHKKFAHSPPITVSVDAGSAIIDVCGTPREGVVDVGAEGTAWRGTTEEKSATLRRTPISESQSARMK